MVETTSRMASSSSTTSMFSISTGLPSLGIICDGTHKWGCTCPVRKQRVSVSEGSLAKVSRRPKQALRQHEHRSDGTSHPGSGAHAAAESRVARNRILRSDCLSHFVGPLSSIPPRSPGGGVFPFLAYRMVLLCFLFVMRSGAADSPASRTAPDERFGASRRFHSRLASCIAH